MQIIKYILLILLAYLLGSIPWGLVIGKAFFNTDIREYGSHNLGGTNAARTLGLPIGILVILLDSLKALIMMYIVNILNIHIEEYVGLAVCIGHCFPIFASFKGGKAVASSFGYLLGLALFVTNEHMFTFIFPIMIFFIILFMFRMVSLASMTAILSASFLIFFNVNKKIGILVFLLALFVIYRHKQNIIRIINKEESKII